MATPRHVMLNALYLAPAVSGGPETYLRGLAPALANEFPKLNLTVATTPSGAAALKADGWEAFARLLVLPCEDGQRVRRQWAEQVLLPLAARRERAEIVHSLASVAPVFAGVRAVVTLHDVTFLVRPTFGKLTTWGMGLIVRGAARRADALIAGSAAARDEVCAVLGLAPGRFTVIHHGYDPARAAGATSAAAVRDRFELGQRRVVLCVGAKRPHKNQALLVRAATTLAPDVVFVLAGHPEPYEIELRSLARELDVSERIRFVDYVSEADLEGLWAVADCAAFPTLGEGFGLPVLEALAHGVPVAASDIAVLREVGGEIPHYFDPANASAAAQAILAALADRDARRTGPARAAQFTWSAAARATYDVYARALDGASR